MSGWSITLRLKNGKVLSIEKRLADAMKYKTMYIMLHMKKCQFKAMKSSTVLKFL
jgi:hypothetical protein